jgi:hypothetical protein
MRGVLGGLVVLLFALLPATASAEFPGRDIQLLSRASDGGAPDGPSRNPAISQDKRFARFAAYESDATNITAGTAPTTNVYVVERQGPYADNGTRWEPGRTILASVGLNGAAADGPSTRPALSGTSRVAPRCVAFVSAASNLVKHDTNGKPDAFVRFLDTGVTKRVSVGPRGRQSNGTVTEVAVNGLCTRVAFVSDGGDLALTKTRNPSWKSARTRQGAPGVRQVYIRALPGPRGLDKALKGLTFLASSRGRSPGNADSFDIALSNNSRALTYASDATNLEPLDTNGQTDIYQRVMERGYLPKVRHHRPQHLVMTTQLISLASNGAVANGASRAPASNTTGEIVAFQTTAPNLIGADTAGVPQVVQATVGSGGTQYKLASGSGLGGSAPGNASSTDPTISAAGTWVGFQSDATNVGSTVNRGPDLNRTTDAMLFTANTGERWLLGESSGGPTTNPMMSPHGNYIVFERGGQVQLLYTGAK